MKYLVSGFVCELGQRISFTINASEDEAIDQFNDSFGGDLEDVYAVLVA